MKKITMMMTASLLLLGQFAVAQDTCLSAVPITAGLHVVSAVNGTEAPNPICAANGEVVDTTPAGEWYSYTPIQDYSLTITTSIPQNNPLVDTRFHVYTGSCGALACYAGNDDGGVNNSSIAVFNVTANTTYLIAFDNKWTSVGFTFQVIESPVITPIPTPVTFTGQTIPTVTGGYNLCLVDMNNDYLDDIVTVNDGNIRISKQNSNGTFTATDYPTAVAENMPGWSIAAGDYNKDGYNDLLYGGSDGLTFMKSNGLGTGYTKVNPGEDIFCQRTNFIDINNDGHLDAFSCHDVAPNCYYINNGSNEFTFYQTSITPGAMSLGSVHGNYASLWVDYDNDGDSDMFVSKCSSPPCELHRNDGNGIFTDISAQAQIDFLPVTSWSSAIFDFDNDGDMDILVGSNGPVRSKLFKNNLDKSNSVEEAFTNVTIGSGWDADISTNRDYIAYDFDNDGFVDVMGGGNKIMFNKGDGTFTGTTYPGMGIGPVGDMNNDGFLDVQNGNKIYMNSGNPNKWIRVNLQGVQSNRNGIGARVEIYGAWGKQIRDIRSGEGFGYMSTLSAHFGIGTASAIEKVVIKWPSGIVDTVLNPASNQSLFVLEGSTVLGTNNFEASAFSIYPNPTHDVLNIQMANNGEVKDLQVYDLTGRKVLAPATSNRFSVKDLSVGTYILILKDSEGKEHFQKFIKK